MKHTFWNFITAIKNGSIAKKRFVTHSNTKLNSKVASILWNEGYINGYKILEKSNELKLFLKYDKNCVPSIANVKSLSKPGRREYLSYKTLCNISYETGLLIISTSKGVLTLADCKKQKLGGEPLIIIL